MSSARIVNWLGRLYVPFATILLTLMASAFLTRSVVHFNANTALQGGQIEFVKPEDFSQTTGKGLSPSQAMLVRSVISPDISSDHHSAGVLYLGNSQVTAIADRKPGDLCSPQWLQLMMKQRDVDEIAVHAASAGGMVVPEMLVKLLAAREQDPAIRLVILSLHIDEFREVTIRSEFVSIASLPTINGTLRSLVAENPDLPAAGSALSPLLQPHGANAPLSTHSPQSSTVTTSAKAIEDKLQRAAEKHSALFRYRDKLMGATITTFIEGRNRVFHLNSSNVRPIREPVFRANMQALEMLLRYTREQTIRVIMYLAPVRPEQFQLISGADLRKLSAEISPLCRKYDVACANYMDIVPHQYWTTYRGRAGAGQPDYAHFEGPAHRLLAEHLVADFGDQMAHYAGAASSR